MATTYAQGLMGFACTATRASTDDTNQGCADAPTDKLMQSKDGSATATELRVSNDKNEAEA